MLTASFILTLLASGSLDDLAVIVDSLGYYFGTRRRTLEVGLALTLWSPTIALALWLLAVFLAH